MGNDLLERSTQLIYREAALLDQRKWQEWLELYLPDAVFWIPAWDDETTVTDDPKTEISLMYYDGRSGLEDRVWRIQSGMAAATRPTARTCHLVTGVHIDAVDGDDVRVASSFCVHAFRQKKTLTFYGSYEHVLRATGPDLKIAKKKILVLNDVIPGVLDVYNV